MICLRLIVIFFIVSLLNSSENVTQDPASNGIETLYGYYALHITEEQLPSTPLGFGMAIEIDRSGYKLWMVSDVALPEKYSFPVSGTYSVVSNNIIHFHEDAKGHGLNSRFVPMYNYDDKLIGIYPIDSIGKRLQRDVMRKDASLGDLALIQVPGYTSRPSSATASTSATASKIKYWWQIDSTTGLPKNVTDD